MRVYLAGPIFGQSDPACRDWREMATALLPDSWEILNPMARDYRGREDDCAEEIVEGDLLDIRRCHLMLVNAPCPSWGTAMEIRQAYMWDIPIFVVTPHRSISPWLRYHAHHCGHSLEFVCDEMVALYFHEGEGRVR